MYYVQSEVYPWRGTRTASPVGAAKTLLAARARAEVMAVMTSIFD